MRISHVPALLFLAAMACAAPVPVSTPPGGTSAPSSGNTNAAAEVVRLTNESRLANGLRALVISPRLTEAARLHAEQMAGWQRLAHTIDGARYPTMQARLDAAGYAYLNAAENVAWNQRTPADVMRTWLGSSGHRANILDPNLTEIGTAVSYSLKGEPYWIQVFGRPR
jgi:uncharacterized protein YkwD